MSAGLVLVESSAQFSLCRRYRYTLTRRFDDGPTVAFIGLNPSTADEHADDPTIRRCLGFARHWGYGQLVMLNLYALRATDPRVLRALPLLEAEGPNLYHIARQAVAARLVVCAWGADPGPDPDRPQHVLSQLRRLGLRPVALALTKHGQPRHPLYVRSDVQPVPYPSKGAR